MSFQSTFCDCFPSQFYRYAFPYLKDYVPVLIFGPWRNCYEMLVIIFITDVLQGQSFCDTNTTL